MLRSSGCRVFPDHLICDHPLFRRVPFLLPLASMFDNAIAFNQPVASWDVGQVTSMSHMFYGARAFNQPVALWDVGQVTSRDWIRGLQQSCWLQGTNTSGIVRLSSKSSRVTV